MKSRAAGFFRTSARAALGALAVSVCAAGAVDGQDRSGIQGSDPQSGP